ncbi:MAG: hypothetical protein Q8K82_18515 [Gemmatimonadaceae bacterium]|nr:hypothetical protein [Gemmatimonadaceae bacterium]
MGHASLVAVRSAIAFAEAASVNPQSFERRTARLAPTQGAINSALELQRTTLGAIETAQREGKSVFAHAASTALNACSCLTDHPSAPRYAAEAYNTCLRVFGFVPRYRPFVEHDLQLILRPDIAAALARGTALPRSCFGPLWRDGEPDFATILELAQTRLVTGATPRDPTPTFVGTGASAVDERSDFRVAFDESMDSDDIAIVLKGLRDIYKVAGGVGFRIILDYEEANTVPAMVRE